MDIEIKVEGLDELIAALDQAGKKLPTEMRAVLQRGAMNIKKDWQARWAGLGHAPALPYAVSYDTKELAYSASAEIGPDKGRRQGALGNLLEFGSVNNAPHPGGLPALEAEAPRFEKALADLAGKLLDG
jgi:hypothetical protein